MEHRWGQRLLTNIPVRLRCAQLRDSGCSCLGCLENVSASGALIRTQLGTHPAPQVLVEALIPALGVQGRELQAFIVRSSFGEISLEWAEFASTGVSALLTETVLHSAAGSDAQPLPALGRARFCALAPTSVEKCPAGFSSPAERVALLRSR